ncbi:MAG: DeoR/GlpR family DNA-binding transcription regulator [Microbacterium sp.]
MATNRTVDGEQRRTAILAAVDSEGAARLTDLASRLEVSEMTVRRDLDELELSGQLRRVRGGAVAIERPRHFDERRATRPRAKQVIARKAAELLPTTGAVAFDASSTVGTIAANLDARPKLSIVTNSIDNYIALRAAHAGQTVLTGGEAEPSTGSLVGPVACAGAVSMLYKLFFLSSTGFDAEHGTSEVSLIESQVKQVFARASNRVVLCLDSAKLGGRSSAATLATGQIDTLITELDPSDPRLAPFRGLVAIR